MLKILPAILLHLLCYAGNSQEYAPAWNGKGEYLSGQSITAAMKNMAAEKKLIFNVSTDGTVSGKLVTAYNRSKAIIAHEIDDQHFSLSGKYFADKSSLLLIITHFRSKPEAIESYLTFNKPDSIYYDLSAASVNNKVVTTGIANKILNANTTGEWVGSFMGGGLGMNLRNNESRHILPLRIRFENNGPSLPLTIAVKPVLTDTTPAAKTVTVVLAPMIRETKIQRTVALDTSFVKIDLYDNGDIDGDIATLVLDGKIILNKQLLSATASTIYVNLSRQNPEHTLELVANNMGTIPPNTALLILTCKGKRYEINLTSTEKANGSVRLIFKGK
jgi:hypothetical protein